MFFKDYAESHKKLSELGFSPNSAPKDFVNSPTVVLAQSAVGVIATAVVIILGYLYEARRNVKAK